MRPKIMATKSTAKKTTKAKAAPKAAPAIKPIKDAFSKSALIAHLAEQASVETKHVKAVLAALEQTVLGAVHKKGAGNFTLPGLFKINAVKVPAKPKRKGKNPFTGEEQVFAAKPASVKVKVRPLKKLKDAAL
ncbi:nucleoid DNA-binding protein [Rhodanobacter glycinis]|jgi:nucleoid DNA-binding protein|uniref:Viral histone-like protein n=2 Tax=Rhodanobacter glycinis TaxID=582702 RepID=A0A1I3YDI4_9GAMM|nr:histone family protein DNA-binding protein [Rhodanobacter sp. 115]SFK29934.1 nucleoid DNA-binding protein [Rhodanobacter glycinis]